jgi:hypothetical protein
MKDTVAFSLSKALKIKSRLAGRFASLSATISIYNSMEEGRQGEVDILALDKQKQEMAVALIQLKTAIYEANRGIYLTLNELSEKKSEVSFLSTLNTRHGAEQGYNSEKTVYVAAISKQEVDRRVKKLEKEIDDLQDVVDKYNAETERVRLSAKVLELVS